MGEEGEDEWAEEQRERTGTGQEIRLESGRRNFKKENNLYKQPVAPVNDRNFQRLRSNLIRSMVNIILLL